MKIELKEILIRDLCEGYIEIENEGGIVGYYRTLDIRPQYQREFVYNNEKRDAVIDTIIKGYPLNVMYWAIKEFGFEIIDGQQRTISICRYVEGDFSLKGLYFHNLDDETKNKILDYKLTIYLCIGDYKEKLDWFETINIAGEKLSKQELRNAVYAGTWVSFCRRKFCKTLCPAYNRGAGDYMEGTAIRQDYFETLLRWKSDNNITDYMGRHQHDLNCDELWDYFLNIISWIETIFCKRKEMKGVPWGFLYNEYKNTQLDRDDTEVKVEKLMADDDVVNKKGIYSYIFDGKERHLNIRSFSRSQKSSAYTRQNGICPICNEKFDIDKMEADHITPWIEGGKTEPANCQLLCKEDNRRKSNR